jgi:hypothetical protein
MKRSGFGAVCVLLFPSFLHAQAGTPKTTPPAELVAHFVDGSVIRRVRVIDSIDVQTRYGKLSVPITEIRRIEFATRLSEETSRQIERAIDGLGNRAFAQRENATRELTALGARAYPALKKAASSADKEVSRRAQEVIAQIEQTVAAEQLLPRPQDVIHTADSVLTGQILTTSLKAKTSTFGESQLAICELQAIHLETQARSLAVDAASFTTADRQWVDSGITVDAGSDLRVQAVGDMDVMSKDAPGQHRCGPDGCGNFARSADGMLSGMLIGRIGEQGTPFIVGSNHQLKGATGSGKLYLCVIPGRPGQLQGNYQVRITTGIGIANDKQQAPPATPVPSTSASFNLPAALPVVPVAPAIGVRFQR